MASGRGWDAAEGKLDLENEGRAEWPTAEIERAGPANIRVLDLDGNRIRTIPADQLLKLTRLEKLWLYENRLTAIPKEIGQLPALRILYLNNNELASLPPEVGRLTALRELMVHGNKLTAVPVDLGRLSALKRLDVSNNQLATIPAEIGRLPALRELCVAGNPLAGLPAAARVSEDAVLAHLRSLAPRAPGPAPAAPPRR